MDEASAPTIANGRTASTRRRAPVSAGSSDLMATKSRLLSAPKLLAAAEARGLRWRAKELAREMKESSGSKGLETIDSIANLGLQAQRGSASEINLLRGRVGDMLNQEGPAAQISGDMVELRLALKKINPHELDRRGVLGWLIRGGPLGDVADALRDMLEKIAIRYEPVSKQINVIETRLREGRTMLAQDNIELRKLYESVENQQLPIQKNAYLGELLMREIDAIQARTDDELKRERIRNLLHDLSLRVQDLRTMEEVGVQFFVSIEMTRQNNTRLAQAVERTLALSANIVVIGLAIQMALARQKRVTEANKRTREFLGDIVITNAAAIKRHTNEIGDAYNNPVIAIEKLTTAHNDLIEALETVDRIKQEGIAQAKVNIDKLAEMAEDLDRRSRGLREVELPSIEA
jgi:uncharacterized protein YaaN involved in tellurite resistance